MKPTTTFSIPWPPSVNGIYVRTRGGTVLSKRVVQYRNNVAALCYEQRVYRWRDERLDVRIVARPPDRKVRDLDNLLKATLDALQECRVIDNDANIDRILIERGPLDDRTPARRRNGILHVEIAGMYATVRTDEKPDDTTDRRPAP